ncbi:MAG TPA: sulfatase [Opitutaceae bacterium]
MLTFSTVRRLIAALASLCGLAGVGVTARADAPAPRLNVLLIAIDDLGANLGCYGDAVARTPHLDALARRGTLFSRAYCQFPLCNPSRASVLTGLRPDRVAVHDLPTHFRANVPDVVTLPQAFKREGYWTARVGKVFHAGVPAHIGLDGPDDPASWDERVNPRGRDKDDEALFKNLTPGRGPGTALRIFAADGTDEEQTDGKVATETLRLLESARDRGRPFFVAAGFYRPHLPFVAPRRYFDLHPLETMPAPPDPTGELATVPRAGLWTWPPFFGLNPEERREAIRAYHACVSFVDAQIGRVLDGLQRLGLAENTLVVLWSDHGYLLGEHGQWFKESLFEPALRTPLIIASPRLPPTPACTRLVEFVDIFPTTLELAGLPIPGGLDGRSLAPLLRDPERPWPHPALSQVWISRTGAYGRSIRTERYRYSEWGERGADGVQLYDLESDPGEHRNLAGWAEYAATQRTLASELHQRLPWVPGAPPARAASKVD